MTVNLDDMMADFTPARRRKIEDRATELIAEERALRELRKARRLTQVSVARTRYQPGRRPEQPVQNLHEFVQTADGAPRARPQPDMAAAFDTPPRTS